MQDSVLPRGVGLRKPHISPSKSPHFVPLHIQSFSVYSVFSVDSPTLAVLFAVLLLVYFVYFVVSSSPHAVLFLCFPFFVVFLLL